MTETMKELRQLIDEKNKKYFLIIFLMILGRTLLETAGISLLVPLFSTIMDENIMLNNKLIGSICVFFHINDHKMLVIICIIVMIVTFILKNVITLAECRVRYHFLCESRHSVQKKIFRSILDRPYVYFLKAQTSEIIREVADDCNRTFALMDALLDVYANLFLVLGIVVMLFIIDRKMAIAVMTIVLILSIALIVLFRPVLKKQGSILVKYATENYKNVLEGVQGIKIVKITRSKEFFNEEFKKNGRKVIEADTKNTVLNKIPMALIETVCVVTILLYVLFVFLSGNNANELIPVSGAFIVASFKLFPSVQIIISAYLAIAFNKDAVDNVLENYSRITDENVHIDCEKLTLKDKIELKNITYRYSPTGRKILNDASLTIPVGESVGIMGISGMGKTTAVDVLLGLLYPEAGSITFDNREMAANIENYPINIGYVPQTIYFRDDTIRRNIAFGMRDEDIDDDRVIEVIKMAQLESYIARHPEGINTLIGENGVRVSGGQRQRIGIARALYNNPDLLIFDEATSSLDLETEESLMESIEALHGTKTMVIIAHRPQIIAGCDHIYRLVDGRFILEK